MQDSHLLWGEMDQLSIPISVEIFVTTLDRMFRKSHWVCWRVGRGTDVWIADSLAGA